MSKISKRLTIFILAVITSCCQVTQAAPGYAGEDSDPNTGQVFLRARYYDPETGTYLTKDPLGIVGGVNTYQYCGGDPVNATDPNGELFGWDTLIGAGIGAVVGVTARFAVDVVHVANGGQWSSANQYLGAAAGGAAFGATLTVAPTLAGTAGSAAMNAFVATTAAGVVGGATGNLVTQGANNLTGAQQGFDSTSFYLDTSVGGLSAGLFSVGGSTLTPVLQQTLSTQAKGTIGEIVGTAANIPEGNIANPLQFQQLIPQTGSYADAITLDNTILEFKSVWTDNGADSILSPITSLSRLTSAQQDTAQLFGLGNGYLAQQVNMAYATPLIEGSGGFFLGENLVGGVLLDKAAALVGANLSDITGAMYDPVSGQFVIMGTNNPAPVKGINLDYLYTALQAVYGSAVPPFVTLVPSANITSSATQTETITVIVYQHYPDQYTTYTVS